MSDTCVLFFVKYPDPGTVKTRLGEVLGHENAAALYRHFVQDLMLELGRVQADLRVMHAPGDDVTARRFKEWLGPQHRYLPQVGSDLGARMRHAFDEVWALAEEKRASLRMGAYMSALKRVVGAKKLRGIFP